MIRNATPSDAQNFLDLLLQLDNETKFMLFEKGERKTTVEQQRKRLEHFQQSDSDTMIVTLEENKPIGFIAGMGGNANRNRHSLYIVMGVLQKYTGHGKGKKLLAALENWAIRHEFHRLELTVMTHNKRAISLYEKCGFQSEGIKKDSLFVDGHYIDEFYMAKLL